MEFKKLLVSGLCPYCPATLDYEEDANAVVCPSCGNTVPTRLMRPLFDLEGGAASGNDERRIADSLTSPSAGIIYLDNFVDSYDWHEFALNSDLSIGLLDAIAETAEIKFPTDPITYVLAFRCTAVPALRKVEGLGVLEVNIIESYKADDVSGSFGYMDLYCGTTKAIADKRDLIIARLSKDIELAAKFGADQRIIDDLQRSIELFREKILAVNVANTIEDVPGYDKAKELHDAELFDKYYALGINAEKTYEKAIANLDAGNVDAALHLFRTIIGYKQSEDYINRYSSTFKFNEELIEMSGSTCYIVKDDRPYFDPAKPENSVAYKTKKLYSIVDNAPGKVVLTGISNIIHSYGSRIFFARNSVSLCVYETNNKELYANVKVLDEAPVGDYVIDGEGDVCFSRDKSKFFLRKKLRSAPLKRGCFGRKKKDKKAPKINRQNNYSIVLVDMDKNVAKTVLPEIVDIMDFYDDKIFYTTVGDSGVPVFKVYDVNTGVDMEILNENCIIHNVTAGNIIYSRWAPNEYNLDLYSINIEDKTPTVIDKNVSGYYTTYMGKVFYTVGAEGCEHLYSANLDGTEITEIIENPGRICKENINSGWLYYVSGEGQNACLMKVSADGKKTALVASRFGKLVKMQNGYVFYLSTSGDLRVVRSDGKGDKRIAEGVADQDIIIDYSKVYYLKRDKVAPATEDFDGYGLSLYTTDLDGKSFRKLAHNVVAMTDYDNESIYVCRKADIPFIVTTPVDKKTTTTETVVRTVTTYESYNKVTGEVNEVVRVGLPTKETLTYKAGCFLRRKLKTKEGTITEVGRSDYLRSNVAKTGMVLDEELEAERLENERIAAEKQAKRDRRKNKRKKNAEADTNADGKELIPTDGEVKADTEE
ncbi:MAG: DUF5050 domain-containing protein [Clostridia bacterium]|nr:DUF5050 domain-containing protein [Clostridia bacterium]